MPTKKSVSKKKVPAKPTKKRVAKVVAAPAAVAGLDPAAEAEAAAEVVQAVWLHEDHFELENEVVTLDGIPLVEADAEGHLWVTVKIHVPRLDVEMWLDGTHFRHPDNLKDDEDDDA